MKFVTGSTQDKPLKDIAEREMRRTIKTLREV